MVALTGFPGPVGTARADTTPNNNANPYFTLSIDPAATQNLVDGQAIPFTVTRTAQLSGQSCEQTVCTTRKGEGAVAADILPL